MSRLSEKTLIPISFVLVLLGGAGWLTNLRATVLQHGEQIEGVDGKLGKINECLQRMQRSLGEIEGELKRMGNRK